MRATCAGLVGIQPHRTALASATLMMEWIWRTVAAPKGTLG